MNAFHRDRGGQERLQLPHMHANAMQNLSEKSPHTHTHSLPTCQRMILYEAIRKISLLGLKAISIFSSTQRWHTLIREFN